MAWLLRERRALEERHLPDDSDQRFHVHRQRLQASRVVVVKTTSG